MTAMGRYADDHHTHHAVARRSPTDVLRDEHVLILRALTVADALAGAVTRGGPLDRAALGRLVDFLRAFADRCHHGKEEAHLFPAMAKHGVPVEGGPLGVMQEEHEEGRRFIAAMSGPDDAAVAAAIGAYVALLRAHIDKEDGVLFPIAEGVLPPEEQSRLAKVFDTVEQEEIGPGEHERLVGELARLEAAVAVR